jgi:transcriptional regulator of acetoin/glycerol metabolism
MGRRLEALQPSDLERLQAYSWPGNVRELQNAIERAVLVCRTGKIDVDDLPLTIHGDGSKTSGRSLGEIERQHIKRTLEETGWNIYRAARLLEIDRVTLYNRIKKYGFTRQRPAAQREIKAG